MRSDTSTPLTEAQRATFRAYLPHVLGLHDTDASLLDAATDRLDAYVQSIPPHEPRAREKVTMLLNIIRAFASARQLAAPENQSFESQASFVEALFESDSRAIELVFDGLSKAASLLGMDEAPSIRDLAKSLRELMGLAYYSNPATDAMTGYDAIWTRAAFLRERPDVDTTRIPGPSPSLFDPKEVTKHHYYGHPYDEAKLFNQNGKPKVAVIGSGAGGAVVAARLAKDFDVALFEAGPRLRPSEYPTDTLVGMGLLFEDGLMTLSQDLDLHLLRGRVMGGGTVMTSGLSVKLRKGSMAAMTSGLEADTYLGIEQEEWERGFELVKERQALGSINPSLFTDVSGLLKKGADRLSGRGVSELSGEQHLQVNDRQWCLNEDVALNNVMMEPGAPRRLDQNGDYCLGCGLCNSGCHFGHKLSMDMTYILDAEAAGAKVHENLPVAWLDGDKGKGGMEVQRLHFARGPDPVLVDYVVLAAGAVGSPALLLKSAEAQSLWETTRPFMDGRVGTGLGFNYGSGIVAKMPGGNARPGHMGFQIQHIATRGTDEDFDISLIDGRKLRNNFVLENAFVPPSLMSNLVPGVGQVHADWMKRYRDLAMCATTIGSPQHGVIRSNRRVEYTLSEAELDWNRVALANAVRVYLAAGAEEVAISGVRQGAPKKPGGPQPVPGVEGVRFTQAEHSGWSTERITKALREVITKAEHLMVSSSHPQGGLRMNANPELGAVDGSFRLRGASNVFVADASLFPQTIVVNPQWSIAALAEVASKKIREHIKARQQGS